MVELNGILWLAMGGLAYVLVTCVLGTLASRVKNERERHDLVVGVRQRRQTYLDELQEMEAEEAETAEPVEPAETAGNVHRQQAA